MKLLNYDFTYFGDIVPEIGPDSLVQSFMPQNRYVNAGKLPLNKYGAGPFCKFRIATLPKASGVYALLISDEVRYIGQCSNFRSRFNNGYGNISPRNCFKNGQETNVRLNSLIYLAVAASEVVSLWLLQTFDYILIEDELRSELKPIWNLS